jgi:hypothetical protein
MRRYSRRRGFFIVKMLVGKDGLNSVGEATIHRALHGVNAA